MGLFGGNKQEKSVAINVNDKYVMWEVDISNVAYNAEVTIEAGCRAIYLVNGKKEAILMPGRRRINAKEDKRDKNTLRLIGVCAEKNFVVRIGVGGVPYKDWEMNIETTVGTHGDCSVCIQDPYELYKRIGKSDVTQEDVDEFIRSKISELLKTELALVLQNCDYFTVTTEQSHISSQLIQKFKTELFNVGVDCDNFSLKEIFFPEEYSKARKAKEENDKKRKEEKEQRREREREQRAEIDAFNSLNLSNVGGSNTTNNPTSGFCPACGSKIPSDAKFCTGCGKKIS